jgi:LPS O-antigen subunit length determinant protein (WzzB/FepE family)
VELNLITILVLAAVFTAGAFLGVLLAGRSKTANAIVARIRAEYDEKLAEARAEIARLRAKAK